MQRYFRGIVLSLLSSAAHAATPPLAVQLNTQNIERLQPGGPDAIAGLGDWVLSNGTLCAAISDIDHETGFNPWGGALIDVHHCGEDDDQWTFQHALPNLDKDQPLKPVLITSSRQDEWAAVVVTAEGYGLQLRSRYQVDTTHPRQLMVTHRLVRREKGEAVTMFGLLMLHPHLSLTLYFQHHFSKTT